MSVNALKRVLLTVLIICSQQFLSLAQGKNFFISKTDPSWIIKVTAPSAIEKPKDISDGYYLSLLEDQNHVELQENYVHVIRQIVSYAGVQNGSEISVTYDPSYQKLIFHKITVWRNNQPQDRLVASKFKVLQNEKDLSRFIYSGTYDAYIILDDIRKGDRIEFSYTIKGNNPTFGDKYAGSFYFDRSTDVGYLYTNLIAKKERQLTFKSFNFSGSPKTSEHNGLKTYEWENKSVKKYKYADYEPSWYNSSKRTQVSEYQNWAEIVDWGLKVNSYPDLKTPLVDQKVKELEAKAKNDPVKYIELATRFVQDEIRYMGIEMGEYSQRPNSPEKVFKQRYGDCKDKSLLLVYLLSKSNITAYMAYVDTYAGQKTSASLPSPFLFNHAVVVVERNGVKTWIDPTISYQRGSFSSIYFPNYGQALVLKPGVKSPENVISIPIGKLVADLTFKVADTVGSAKTSLVIKSTYTGNYADDIRSYYAEKSAEGMEKAYLEYITKYYPDAESSAAIQIKDDENENIFEITESYTIDDFWLKEEKAPYRNYVYFYGDLIQSQLRDIKAKGRIEPMALKYPVNIEENIKITLPFMVNVPMQTERVETDDYYFEFNGFRHGGEIHLNYIYRNLTDYVGSGDVEKYVKDKETITNLLSYSITRGASLNSLNMDSANPYMVLLALMTVIVSAFFFIRIHQQQSGFELEELADAKPIGGWLILVAVMLILLVFGIPTGAIGTQYFDQSVWVALAKDPALLKFSIGAAYCIIIIAYSLKFNWILLLLVLFFNRRKELPLQLIRYSIFVTAINIFTFTFQYWMIIIGKRTAYNYMPYANVITLMVQLIAVGVLLFFWIRLIRRSARVRETFVFTYPETSWRNDLQLLKNKRLEDYFKQNMKQE